MYGLVQLRTCRDAPAPIVSIEFGVLKPLAYSGRLCASTHEAAIPVGATIYGKTWPSCSRHMPSSSPMPVGPSLSAFRTSQIEHQSAAVVQQPLPSEVSNPACASAVVSTPRRGRTTSTVARSDHRRGYLQFEDGDNLVMSCEQPPLGRYLGRVTYRSHLDREPPQMPHRGAWPAQVRGQLAESN